MPQWLLVMARSRAGENADKTGLRNGTAQFATSHDAAGNGSNGAGAARGALRYGKLRRGQQGGAGHRGIDRNGFHVVFLVCAASAI